MRAASEWDVICVGAGITSLAFGAQLVLNHPGVRVLVVDKHSLPGGYATWFRRPKVSASFECSLHKLSGMAAGGNLKRILGRLTSGSGIRFVPAESFFRYHCGALELQIDGEERAAERQLVQAFPADAAGIARFFEDVRTHGKNGYFQFQTLSGEYEPPIEELQYARRHLKKITVAARFAQLFGDDRLKDLLAAPLIYVGGLAERTSYLYYLHVVYATLNQGSAYLVGSAQALSNHLTGVITNAGGAVLLSNPVRRVLWDERMAVVGVETRFGSFFAPNLYINAAPKYAMTELFADLQERPAIERKLEALENSSSVTTLYLLTDVPPAELGFDCAESMLHGDGHARALQLRLAARGRPELMEDAYWRAGTMEITNYHAVDPSGSHAVVANVLDVIDHWPQRRYGKAYKEKKARARQILLERIVNAFPALRGHISYVELSTPRTYERFTNNTAGAGFGAMVGPDVSGFAFHQAFPVRGIRFLSSWVAGPGYEAAFGYAEMHAAKWTRAAETDHQAWRRQA
jgi:phytoene dehydrogenase-like protein